MTGSKTERLAYLLNRLKQAKRRALYWSSVPSFSSRKPRARAEHRHGGEKYELAMCDIHSLSISIRELGGDSGKPYDPKKSFSERFNRNFVLKGKRHGTGTR